MKDGLPKYDVVLCILKFKIQLQFLFSISSFNFFLSRVLNTSHAFSNIVNKHGVRGLWKGWAPNVQRAALVNMGGKFDVTVQVKAMKSVDM